MTVPIPKPLFIACLCPPFSRIWRASSDIDEVLEQVHVDPQQVRAVVEFAEKAESNPKNSSAIKSTGRTFLLRRSVLDGAIGGEQSALVSCDKVVGVPRLSKCEQKIVGRVRRTYHARQRAD